MFPEGRLLHEEVDAFNRIAVKVICVIIVTKVVRIGHTIATHFGQFPTIAAHCVGCFVQSFQSSVGQSMCEQRVQVTRQRFRF